MFDAETPGNSLHGCLAICMVANLQSGLHGCLAIGRLANLQSYLVESPNATFVAHIFELICLYD